MRASYDSNMGFQGRGFQSGDSICKPMDLTEYYNTNYTPMFDGKGGAAKKAASAKKAAAAKKAATKKPIKKRGGTDSFDEFAKLNISLPLATQAGGTELASEYYTLAQQGSYAPYNASKDEKYGGGRKKRVYRGGISMGQAEGTMNQRQGNMNESMGAADSATRGGNCGCGYKPKTSGARYGGSDGYYADTITGNDAVVERKSIFDGQLDGGAAKAKKRSSSSSSKGTKKPTKEKSSSKGTKKPTRKHKGGDDSAGVGSDFATTLASRGPSNYPDAKSADLFRIFNKTSEFIPNSMLKYAAAPQSTGYAPDPNPYPRAYNDDFIGGTKKTKSKAKAEKKSTSSKTKAKPAKKSTSSSKTNAKPTKNSTSSKAKAKKH